MLQSSEMRCFVEKTDFFTCSEILLWSTRTQGTRSCSGSVARESDCGRSPHAVPSSLAKIHRFREKADSKKNISRSNSPTGDYSGLVFSFFGVSFSVHLAIHLLMFAFRSIETSTPAFYSCRIKEVYRVVVEEKVTDGTGESQSVVAQLRFCRPRVLKKLSK